MKTQKQTNPLYAFRSKRSAHDTISEVHGLLQRAYTEVVDTDLTGYFDTIPDHQLMKSIARRVTYATLLALIKAWLEIAIEESAGKGNKRRSTINRDSGKATPPGAPWRALEAR